VRFIVCYDVSDDRRRDRIAGALLDYGARIQESVFIATLDDELRERMLERLGKLVDAAVDSVFVFPLCRTCAGKATTIGVGNLPQDREYYVL
jgi:CRISPR-associated protein Cas2